MSYDKHYCYKKCEYDCSESKCALDESLAYVKDAIISVAEIFELFNEPNTCKRLDCSGTLYDNAEKAMYCLEKSLCKVYTCYDSYCYYCKDESIYLVKKSIKNTKCSINYWEEFKYVFCNNKCECVECELFALVRKTLQQLSKVDIGIRSLQIMLKDDYCKKC